ncbi:MAG: NMD3-related protein [Candidatus Thermoplasmatota archaeon]|nr:NMD3-related protein [Candidatus Thermoplasmatota archaeon]
MCEDCKRGSSSDGVVKSVKIKRCPHCGSVFLGGWSERSISEKDVVSDVISTVFNAQDLTFEATGDEYNRKVSFEGTSRLNGEAAKGQFFLRTSLSTCPVCAKKLGNYYEAILQLRGEKGESQDSILNYLVDLIEKAPSKEVFLTKMDRMKEGYDLYLSDKQYTRGIARKVIERFGGTYKETSHLVGMKKGNELYRITVSVRTPNFQKSDVLGINKNLYLVISIRSDVVTLLDFKNRSREKMKLQEMKDYVVYRKESDIREADVLYREDETAYILDPFDFKEKAVVDSEESPKVRVIKVDGELFVVPSK